MWHIVHDQIMYIHELLLCNPCESLDPMQDIFRMVTLQLLKLDLNGRERIFVYYHVHSSFPFFQIKMVIQQNVMVSGPIKKISRWVSYPYILTWVP